MSETVSPEEWRWRAWFLGEGEFKKYGRRNPAYRHLTGAPAKIPADWWQRLETFLAKREGNEEPPVPTYPMTVPGGVLVSEHFRAAEFDCHDGRATPTFAYPALVRLAATFLEPLREEFGTVYVTSGYRPADYNKRIGGAPRSEHIYELTPQAVAADLIPKHGEPTAWGRFLRRIADGAHLGGVGVYTEFVHIDNGPRRDW